MIFQIFIIFQELDTIWKILNQSKRPLLLYSNLNKLK